MTRNKDDTQDTTPASENAPDPHPNPNSPDHERRSVLAGMGGLLTASSLLSQESAGKSSQPVHDEIAPLIEQLGLGDGSGGIFRRILQQPPFPPTDVDRFSPQVYPSAPPLEPAGPRPVDETSIKFELFVLFARRFRGNQRKIRRALALYDDPKIEEVIPNPLLRGSLVALKRTAGEAAISAIQKGVYERAYFDDLADGTAGEVHGPPPVIVVNNKYIYERVEVLAPVLLHETMHQDPEVTMQEEMLSHSMDTMIYGEFVLENPGVAARHSELTRRENNKFMARLNSRDKHGRLRLLTGQGPMYPCSSVTLETFASNFPWENNPSTPGNFVLKRTLQAITGRSPPDPDFSVETVHLLDQYQVLFSPRELVFLALALRLDISGHTDCENLETESDTCRKSGDLWWPTRDEPRTKYS